MAGEAGKTYFQSRFHNNRKTESNFGVPPLRCTSAHSRSMESERLIPETQGLLDQDLDQGPPALADDDIQDSKQTIRGRIVSTIANQTYRVTASVFIVWFLLEFGLLALHVPGSRLFERAVCRRYYRDKPSIGVSYHVSGEIDEHLCKISPIQQEVALLVGWRDSFLAIPSEWSGLDKKLC